MTKTRVAFIKFGGLAAGGTERFIQNMAAGLPKDQYDVTYFYCDAAPYVGSDWKHPDTDPGRKKFLEEARVKLVKFEVAAKDVRQPHHPWLETNFFDVFNEHDYDIIQTGRAGHPEFPFTEINDTTIVDAITLPGMAERKQNVAKAIHISRFQAASWVNAGGDPNKVEVIPVFSDMDHESTDDLRSTFGIPEDAFVFGMHQRDDEGIVSPVPLQAYKQIETDNTYFVMMGGHYKYTEIAESLEIKNFKRLPHSGDVKDLSRFLRTLNMFAHGRSDGETFGLCIAEAMSFGLPIVTHVAPAMGHVETIGEAGFVAKDIHGYSQVMASFIDNPERLKEYSEIAKREYNKRLSTEANMKKVIKIYEEVMKDKDIDALSDDDFWEQV